LVPFVLLGLAAPGGSPKDCEEGCQTTVVVQDCDEAPVANATVQVKLCCENGKEVSSSTNANGEATLSYCLEDICDSRIMLAGFAVTSVDRNTCSGSDKNKRCVVKICPR
jgi:hypothetical protein